MIKLRELRENRGISVKDMCRKLGVDDSRYRKWESGINGLPLEFSLACCDILHCTLDDLAGRSTVIEYHMGKLSAQEVELVTTYRLCSQKGREYLLKIAEITAEMFTDQQ